MICTLYILVADELLDGGGHLLQVGDGELAHVRDAEGLVLQIAIAVADGHVAFGEEGVEGLDVHHFTRGLDVAVDDREGLGEVIAVGIYGEVLVGPGAGPGGHLLVAGEAGFDAFLVHDVLQLAVEAVHQREAGGGGVLVVLLVDEVPEVAKVEVETAVLDLRGALVGLFADGGDSHAGGQSKRLLGGGDEHVDAELVRLNLGTGGGGNGVHAPHDVGVLLHDLGDFLHGVLDTGGGFVVGHGHKVVLARGESFVHHLGGGGLAHHAGELVGGHAVGLGHLEPLVTEGTHGEHGGALGGAGANSTFHETGAGGGGEQDAVIREENLLKVVGDALLQLGCRLGAVGNHRAAEFLENVLRHDGRTGDKQFDGHGEIIKIVSRGSIPPCAREASKK